MMMKRCARPVVGRLRAERQLQQAVTQHPYLREMIPLSLPRRLCARSVFSICFAWGCLAAAPGSTAWAQDVPEACPRPSPGANVPEPAELRSVDGVLEATLSIRDERAPDGSIRYCYRTPEGVEAPTLRVRPGDLVVLRLSNQLGVLEAGTVASAGRGT